MTIIYQVLSENTTLVARVADNQMVSEFMLGAVFSTEKPKPPVVGVVVTVDAPDWSITVDDTTKQAVLTALGPTGVPVAQSLTLPVTALG